MQQYYNYLTDKMEDLEPEYMAMNLPKSKEEYEERIKQREGDVFDRKTLEERKMELSMIPEIADIQNPPMIYDRDLSKDIEDSLNKQFKQMSKEQQDKLTNAVKVLIEPFQQGEPISKLVNQLEKEKVCGGATTYPMKGYDYVGSIDPIKDDAEMVLMKQSKGKGIIEQFNEIKNDYDPNRFMEYFSRFSSLAPNGNVIRYDYLEYGDNGLNNKETMKTKEVEKGSRTEMNWINDCEGVENPELIYVEKEKKIFKIASVVLLVIITIAMIMSLIIPVVEWSMK